MEINNGESLAYRQFLKATKVDEIKGKDLHREKDLGMNPAASNIRDSEEKEPARETVMGSPMRMETN